MTPITAWTMDRTRCNLKNNSSPPSTPVDPVGIGLRHPYYRDVVNTVPDIGWLEVHPENFFGGGAPLHYLSGACKHYPLSLHAVGLSLGSDQPVCENHLARFKDLIDEFNPFNISDHASWSASGNAHLGDLLPLPYTQETLEALCRNIDRTQDFFGRKILVENPSTYVVFKHNEMNEYEFMNRAAEKTGCGILLDLNNIYVQCHNHGYEAQEYIDGIEATKVGEIHLAGHIEKLLDNERTLLIDTHNRPVKNEVWTLYEYAVERLGRVPTLIEWDQDFPGLDKLIGEAHKARAIMDRTRPEDVPHAAE